MIQSIAFATGDPVTGTTLLSGVVLESTTQELLTGVKVSVKGTNLYTYTDREGKFTLEEVPAGMVELSFQLVSFNPDVLKVNAAEADSEALVIELQER